MSEAEVTADSTYTPRPRTSYGDLVFLRKEEKSGIVQRNLQLIKTLEELHTN